MSGTTRRQRSVQGGVVAREGGDEVAEVGLGPPAEALVEPAADGRGRRASSRCTASGLADTRVARPSSGSGSRTSSPRSHRCCTCRLIAPLSTPKLLATAPRSAAGPRPRGRRASGTTRAGGRGARARARSPITRLHPADQHADLLLEAAERRQRARTGCPPSLTCPAPSARARPHPRRRIVVRSGTSRMNSTQTSASDRERQRDQEEVAGRLAEGVLEERAHRRRQRRQVGDGVALVAARRHAASRPGRRSPAWPPGG